MGGQCDVNAYAHNLNQLMHYY